MPGSAVGKHVAAMSPLLAFLLTSPSRLSADIGCRLWKWMIRMRKFVSAGGQGWLRAAVTALVLLGAPALLGACSATGQKISGIFNQNAGKPDDIPPEYFTRPAYCPIVRIRGGTEAFTVYERGHEGDPEYVRYQGSITKTARECRKTLDGFDVKVGVAGRAVAGPKGGAGTVTLPVRVVLTQQSTGVKFSQLYKVSATLVPPDFGGDFSQVVDWIPVTAAPNEKDFIVYVGFDEGKTG